MSAECSMCARAARMNFLMVEAMKRVLARRRLRVSSSFEEIRSLRARLAEAERIEAELHDTVRFLKADRDRYASDAGKRAAKLDAAEAENTRLRAALAHSDHPCAYCSLEEWATCKSGFPGCDRADDAMGCPHLGASLGLDAAQAEIARLTKERDGWESSSHEWKRLTQKAEDRAEAAEAEIVRLTPYVEAFRREERRADALEEKADALSAALAKAQQEGVNVKIPK